MKQITLILTSFLLVNTTSQAQLWEKLKQKAEDKISQKVDNIFTKKERKKKKDRKSQNSGIFSSSKDIIGTNNNVNVWRNYKFIPGENIIFYDDLRYEEVGEFPSKWDLRKGGAEVASFNTDKVIIGTASHDNTILPIFKKDKYLSDEFTIDFDIYVDETSKTYNNSWVDYDIILNTNSLKYPNIKCTLRSGFTRGQVEKYDFQLEKVELGRLNAWHHMAISYNKGNLKIYYDEKRIANLPRVSFTPNTFGIRMEAIKDGSFNRKLLYGIKNIRIANGGSQLYKRILNQGKYSTNAILFDSGASSIQTQSMGVINKLVSILKEYPDWNFEIIGHTDSDGDNSKNLTLSEKRAETVKKVLIEQGIKSNRLTTSGKGETELLFAESNTESKMNNRRVEFIKK